MLPDGDFAQHVYPLLYGYDLEGRRAWMTKGTDSTAYTYESTTGQLARIRDPANNFFAFRYDTVGRATQRTMLSGLADSVYERTTYDAASHRTALTGTMATGTATYDGRGKMYSTDATVTYSPLGTLTSSNDGLVIEAYVADPLGNILRTDVSGPDLPTTQPKYSAYSDSTAQLILDSTRVGSFTSKTNYSYNPQTGVLVSSDHLTPVDLVKTEHRTTRNFYDNQLQLDSTTFLVDTIPLSAGHLATDYHAAESYRYDALNRRVWMRNIRDANCIRQDRISGCRSNERRTVWDGDQILYEIQVPGDSGSAFLDTDGYSLAPYFGTVRYTHGLGIGCTAGALQGDAGSRSHTEYDGQVYQWLVSPNRKLRDLLDLLVGGYGVDVPNARHAGGRATELVRQPHRVAAGCVGAPVQAQPVLRSAERTLHARRPDWPRRGTQCLRVCGWGSRQLLGSVWTLSAEDDGGSADVHWTAIGAAPELCRRRSWSTDHSSRRRIV